MNTKMEDTAKLIIDGKTYELPIITGTEGERAIDISQLRKKSGLITLDAGSKAISPDTPAPHFRALGLPENVEFVVRSEEHQALRVPPGSPIPSVGDVFYLVSRHICTTINLFDEAHIIDGEGRFSETWPVDGRGH